MTTSTRNSPGRRFTTGTWNSIRPVPASSATPAGPVPTSVHSHPLGQKIRTVTITPSTGSRAA